MPPVVTFVGKPDSGKTTLLEKLIPVLNRRGCRVGTIKHHVHRFEMDKPGKDTFRHKQAGARVVALSSPTGLGVISDTDGDSDVEYLAARYFGDVDLVIAEGYKRLALPKVEVYRSALYPEPLAGRDETWVAMVSDSQAASAGLPWFSLDDCEGLASFLIETFIGPRVPVAGGRTTLIVDGAPIPLNAFVEGFLRRSLIGMTSSLKGCRNPKDITITITHDHADD
ncbi:MAG: molybdopterin-guanine dinucleotide biosynthesis protein B [Desulfobulbaceae bacterium]|nr:molybdopterin-guanine dinucleotide biosynthesis protein B [Desulfobulbaceae bacterium]